ncbi:hypothetical protein C1A50_0764 [Paenibacillus polymyxa]|nr:hypothetical protein C1A50_0764 [Paenibacillus polymyxa]
MCFISSEFILFCYLGPLGMLFVNITNRNGIFTFETFIFQKFTLKL